MDGPPNLGVDASGAKITPPPWVQRLPQRIGQHTLNHRGPSVRTVAGQRPSVSPPPPLSCNMVVHALLQGDWMQHYQGQTPAPPPTNPLFEPDFGRIPRI